MTDATAWQYCTGCGQHKLPNAFYTPGKRPANRRPQCRECTRHQMQARYRKRRDEIQAIKIERGCVECGYRDNPFALEFDHLPGAVKVSTVSAMFASAKFTMDDIKAEIAKCEVVCANCHRIRTFSSDRPVPTANWDLKVKPTPGGVSPVEQMALDFDGEEPAA